MTGNMISPTALIDRINLVATYCNPYGQAPGARRTTTITVEAGQFTLTNARTENEAIQQIWMTQ